MVLLLYSLIVYGIIVESVEFMNMYVHHEQAFDKMVED